MSPAASKFITKQMLGLFWYISEYPDFVEFSSTTRRDYFQDCIDAFHKTLTASQKKEVLGAIRSCKGMLGKRTYYGSRFDRFLRCFAELIEAGGDPVFIQLDGIQRRKKLPNQASQPTPTSRRG